MSGCATLRRTTSAGPVAAAAPIPTMAMAVMAIATAASRTRCPRGNCRCIRRTTAVSVRRIRVVPATATAPAALSPVRRATRVISFLTLTSCSRRISSNRCWPRSPSSTMTFSVSRRTNGTSRQALILAQAPQPQRTPDTVAFAVAIRLQLCPIWRPLRRHPS